MKKIFRKLACCSFLSIASIGCFDVEARLPKYMAQRAAELLIETSDLLKDDIERVNKTYEEIKQLLISVIEQYLQEVNSADLFTKVIDDLEKHNGEAIKHFVSVLKKTQITPPSEKTPENISKAMKDAVIAKLKSDMVNRMIGFLYNTANRQKFANWMQDEYQKIIECEKDLKQLKDDAKKQGYNVNEDDLSITPRKVIQVPMERKKAATGSGGMTRVQQWLTRQAQELKTKRGKIQCSTEALESLFKYNFNIPIGCGYDFIKFANQHFPCWTGTLTCFMLSKNSKAHIALTANQVVEICHKSITDTKPAKKIVGILFALELIDNWEDIKKITGTKEVAPKPDGHDPYDCVPVPNTMYKIDESQKWTPDNTQGSCMISTIRNLLYILCRDSQTSTNITTSAMREGVQDAFMTDFCTVSGITSCKTQGEFARKILPGVTAYYQPTLDLFVCALNSLLREDLRERIPIPTPDQYISGSLGIPTKVIETILIEITCHSDLTVTHIDNPTKVSSDWPESCLIINDKTVNKKITIAFGRRGAGHHIEIINIEPAD